MLSRNKRPLFIGKSWRRGRLPSKQLVFLGGARQLSGFVHLNHRVGAIPEAIRS
jgi:hypothetical protein